MWDNKDDHWTRDPRATNGKHLPNEVVAMYNLRGLLGSETVVRIRNFRLDTPSKMYRIYLEYCQFGDLYSFSDDYRGDPVGVPEPFLWHTFESLAVSGLLMEQGGLESNPINVWDVIVHRDYKLANVFLGSPSLDRYRGYPMPKVSDFGLAALLAAANPREPQDFGNCGTPFRRAPEQTDKALDLAKPMLLSSKTNVWGVGNVMWSLIENEDGDENLRWEDFDAYERRYASKKDRDEPRFGGRARKQYTNKIRQLIQQCVAYEPSERPTFKQILRLIRRNTASDDSVDDDLRCLPKSHPGFAKDMHTTRDRFPLGTLLQGVKAPKNLTELPGPPPQSHFDGGSDSDDSDEPGGAPGTELNARANTGSASGAPKVGLDKGVQPVTGQHRDRSPLQNSTPAHVDVQRATGKKRDGTPWRPRPETVQTSVGVKQLEPGPRQATPEAAEAPEAPREPDVVQRPDAPLSGTEAEEVAAAGKRKAKGTGKGRGKPKAKSEKRRKQPARRVKTNAQVENSEEDEEQPAAEASQHQTTRKLRSRGPRKVTSADDEQDDDAASASSGARKKRAEKKTGGRAGRGAKRGAGGPKVGLGEVAQEEEKEEKKEKADDDNIEFEEQSVRQKVAPKVKKGRGQKSGQGESDNDDHQKTNPSKRPTGGQRKRKAEGGASEHGDDDEHAVRERARGGSQGDRKRKK